MVSVGVGWVGTCKREDQGELMEFLEAVAELNDHLLNACKDLPQDPLLAIIVAARQQNAGPPRPNIEIIDETLSEPVLIDKSVFNDVLDFEEAALVLRAPIAGIDGAPKHKSAYILNLHGTTSGRVLCLSEGALRGIDFRVFDPRGLYPGEDRASFVFLQSEHAVLDGRICAAFHRTKCPGLVRFEDIGGADWFLTRPDIHLRYFLEEWFDLLLSVVKFFFMPDLYFWRHEPMSGYARYRDQFAEQRATFGVSAAKNVAYQQVLDAFFAEVAGWDSQNEILSRNIYHITIGGIADFALSHQSANQSRLPLIRHLKSHFRQPGKLICQHGLGYRLTSKMCF